MKLTGEFTVDVVQDPQYSAEYDIHRGYTLGYDIHENRPRHCDFNDLHKYSKLGTIEYHRETT